MEERNQQFICKKCGDVKDLDQEHLNHYQKNYKHKPYNEFIIQCLDCVAQAKKEVMIKFKAENYDYWKKYQREYQTKRRDNIFTVAIDHFKKNLLRNRKLLNIPEEVIDPKTNTFERALIYIGDRSVFERFMKKHNFENWVQVKHYFNSDIQSCFNYFQKKCKIEFISKREMLSRRSFLTRPEILTKDIQSAANELVSDYTEDNMDVRRVIATYLYFITNSQIKSDVVRSFLLDEKYIQASRMFSKNKIMGMYMYTRTSTYAKNYLIKKFKITSKNFNEKKEESVMKYILQYLISVLKDEKIALTYLPIFRASFKSLILSYLEGSIDDKILYNKQIKLKKETPK